MAMRRPRIKPVANILLNSKRKPKQTIDVKSENVGENDFNSTEDSKEQLKEVVPAQEKKSSNNADNLLEVRSETSNDTNANVDNLSKIAASGERNQGTDNVPSAKSQADGNFETKSVIVDNMTKGDDSAKSLNEMISRNTNLKGDSDAFKCPPKVGFQRTISHTSNSGIDDVFYSDIEENAFQMDLEKSPSCPLSPSKNMARPRIRPTPHFGQRRNSFVGSSPLSHTSTNEENHSSNNIVNNDVTQTSQTRRERHHSASISNNSHFLHHHTPHKYLPAGIANSSMGRIRTESGCSVFSDTNASTHKLRKIEDNKQLARKDFESRFHNGVPEKSEIKMYDLIFYNPTTNPMEQKPKPNCKLEENESASIDVKPFKSRIKTDTTDDSEAIPVPQLKLNAKGELILDDKSLVIETTAEQEARKVLANSSLIYLDEYTGMNGFYSRKKRTRDWIPSDTIKFYRCLQNVGTDFSLMVSLFPNRTRRDLKLKFKSEERKNGHLINKALLYPKQFDLESLKKQIDDEEKLREEQIKAKKKKPKKEKKKINCQSKANRILVNGVYQNENVENRVNEADDVPQTEKTIETNSNTVEAESNKKISHKATEKKVKQKKTKEDYCNLSEVEKLIKRDYDAEQQKIENFYAMQRRRKRRLLKIREKQLSIIKKEIKLESKQEPNESEFQETRQLEMEMDELLDMDAVDAQYDNNTFGTIISNTSQVDQYNEQIDITSQDISHTTPSVENVVQSDMDIESYEHRTFVNLDDGSLSVYSNIKDDIVFLSPSAISPEPLTSLSPPIENENNSFESATVEPEITNHETCSSVTSERELNEADIQTILTELAEGSLVLVSSLDPDDPDKVLNEIYMVDKNTGDLCEEPLNIPDNIVQCILTVVS